MRRKLGVCCLVLGICCILCAVGFVLYNKSQSSRAADASEQLLVDVQEQIIASVQNSVEESVSPDVESLDAKEPPLEDPAAAAPKEMLTAKVDGYDCIGVLTIPVLELELPVLTDWSYEKFKLAPCLYYGSYYEPDFVIAAHNYQSHFGKLSQLQQGDLILFTDISGTVHCYEVILLETLPGLATAEMITSGFDLSLYTCTASGSNRTTVRCQAVENQG